MTMTRAAAEKILRLAEKRMGATVVSLTPEQAAQRARMGLSNDLNDPANMGRMARILDGRYPATMTTDDIAEIVRINAMLEAQY
jgi:hypothetical protein